MSAGCMTHNAKEEQLPSHCTMFISPVICIAYVECRIFTRNRIQRGTQNEIL